MKLTEDDILEDAKKISEYLGINCPKIKVNQTSSEGLTLEHLTHLGVKNGYKRKLLIHELLHTKGFQHTYPSNFFPAAGAEDELSTFVEQMVFYKQQILSDNKLRELLEKEFQYYDETFKKHKDIDDFKIAQVLQKLLGEYKK